MQFNGRLKRTPPVCPKLPCDHIQRHRLGQDTAWPPDLLLGCDHVVRQPTSRDHVRSTALLHGRQAILFLLDHDHIQTAASSVPAGRTPWL